jgi:hypothetical protein
MTVATQPYDCKPYVFAISCHGSLIVSGGSRGTFQAFLTTATRNAVRCWARILASTASTKPSSRAFYDAINHKPDQRASAAISAA